MELKESCSSCTPFTQYNFSFIEEDEFSHKKLLFLH